MDFWNNIIIPAFEKILQNILDLLPNVVAAIVILLVGWVVAKLMENLVRRVLARIGFNNLAEKTGINGFLKNAGFKKEVSWLVGRLTFWMLLLVFLLSAADTLNLTTLAFSIQKVVAFIPNLIVVILILVFGAMLAKLAGRLVRATAMDSELDFADFLGKLVTNVVLVIIVVLAVAQLELQSTVIDTTFAAMVAAVALAIALTLGLGSRNIAYNIMCGVYARRTFKIGQTIRLGDLQGEIVHIGTINTSIQNSEGLHTVLNSEVIETRSVIPDA